MRRRYLGGKERARIKSIDNQKLLPISRRIGAGRRNADDGASLDGGAGINHRNS